MMSTEAFLLLCLVVSAVSAKNDGKSFVLDDEEIAKRGANGKPISFKMSNKGDGKGLTEDFDVDDKNEDDVKMPDDDFKMPDDMGDVGGDHDWSRWPFTDVGSPFAEAGFPFNDNHGEDDDHDADWFKHRDEMNKHRDSGPPSMDDMDDDMGMKDEDFLRERERHFDDRYQTINIKFLYSIACFNELMDRTLYLTSRQNVPGDLPQCVHWT